MKRNDTSREPNIPTVRLDSSSRRRLDTASCRQNKQARGAAGTLALMAGCACLLGAGQAAAEPLSAPSFSGPLRPNPDPMTTDVGVFGKLHITGQLTGLGQALSNGIPGSDPRTTNPLLDIGNAQIEIQTTGAPLTFFVQAGAYSLPALGSAYMRATDVTDQLYGPVPVAYAKLELSPNVSVQAGLLPTLIGAESTFTFQNMNIARGLLWNQEPAISRGIQVNYSDGPFSASVSLNDGFYSEKYNWVSGLVSYAATPSSTITLVAAGNLSDTDKTGAATPLAQNNSSIFNVIYTYTDGPLTLQPYLQYTTVRQNREIGIDRSAETFGGALLARYAINENFSIAGRVEYIASSGGDCRAQADCAPTNLLYGPKSRAWSLTVTPTYQRGVFFARTELSYTRIDRVSEGFAFGSDFDKRDQARGMIEAGVLF
jgi:hypothetical protein